MLVSVVIIDKLRWAIGRLTVTEMSCERRVLERIKSTCTTKFCD